MIEFIIFALYICVGCFLIVVTPVMMVPGLALKRKLLICFVGFVILIPLAVLIYSWIGTPQLAHY